MDVKRPALLSIALAGCAWDTGGAAPCDPEVRPIVVPVLLPLEAPQGIAVDSTDGSLWIVSAISSTVLHVGADLKPLGSFEAPFAPLGRREAGGIAYVPSTDTLLISQPILMEVWEVYPDGSPSGTVIRLDLPAPPNLIPRPYAKGLAYFPEGDEGRGSLWVVESVLTAVYEVALDGTVLRSICAPDDPDGCPGEGLAAFTNDVEVVYEAGAPAGLELTAGVKHRDRILRVGFDGLTTGHAVPLAGAGGRVGGFARGPFRDPATGRTRDALFVTVESSAELHVLEVVEGSMLPIEDLACEAAGQVVRLTWTGHDAYDEVLVEREGERIASLPGGAASFDDAAPPDGVLRYAVAARKGGCESRLECQVVLGAGQVLRARKLDGYFAVGIAEDARELLWVTDLHNEIFVYTKDLELEASFPGPFQGEDDATSGIAFNLRTGTFFVYNAATNQVAEILDTGELASGPFPSGVPSDPENEAAVSAMLFDADGAGGAGSFWYLDLTTGTIQERGRAGDLLGSCVHPDFAADPPPPKAPFGPYIFGLSPGAGGGFDAFRASGGRARDLRATRIARHDARSCARGGEEVPTEGIAARAVPYAVSVHFTRHGGRPVAYAINAYPRRSLLLELEVRPPPVPWVRDLTCVQESDEPHVRLAFTNPGGLDALEVRRDGASIAELPGDAASFEDAGPPPGRREYSVRGRRGAERGDDRSCWVQVGPGSIGAREFSFPAAFLHQVAVDPTDGSFIAASSAYTYSGDLYRFDADLRFVETLPSPFPAPLQAAALAVRVARGASEIHCMGWNPGATPGGQPDLPIEVLDRSGRFLRAFRVTPPPPRGPFVTFPSGMAWDSGTDTLWYLERNAAAVVQVSLEGETLAVFPHPAAIHQDGVINYGLAADGARGALYLSSAGPLDHQVTRIVEVTRHGYLTGVEVPVGAGFYERLWGFALDGTGTGLVVASAVSNVSDLVRYRAFGPVPPPRGLTCEALERGAALAWSPGGPYDQVLVFRERDLAASLPGDAAAWTDGAEPPGRFYRVAGVRGGLEGPGALCEPDLGTFRRGDVEENGELNITDAVAILGYLFLGSRAPRCLDAADANDSGELNITDAIYLLGYLFAGGPPPPPPLAAPGRDPTRDDLGCSG
ncbi:MAG: hypothetical protein HY721_29155 [Planctomycetes bacterium]|nr:hypothetical protein [Planctomycetota bacterium]